MCRCRCGWDHPPTFSPLSEILPQRCTPELEYLLARFASLMPYRQVVRLLQEFFPLSPTLNHATVRNRTLRVAQRMEADLAAEAPAEEPVRPAPKEQPIADGASEPAAAAEARGVLICLDTGFVRSCNPNGARHFELTVGRCERPGGSGECFGFVADPEADPIGKARWPVLLARQGHQPGEPLTVISDGADAFVALAQRLGATHILDWFHVAMRFERLHQILRGLRWSHPVEAAAWEDLATRAKWRLWHGQHFRVLEALEDIEDDLGPTERLFWQHAENSPLTLLLHALWALQAFVAANDASLVNYGERYRRGQRISTAVVESMVNRVIERRMTKKQHMRWSRRGAHLLIQVRLAVLEGGLQDRFRRWYLRFQMPAGREATPA